MVPLPWGGALCSLQSTWGKHYRLGRCVCSRSSCFGMLVACVEVRKPWDSVQYLGQDLVRRVAGCPRWLKCEEWAAELDRGSPTKKWEPTPGLQDKGRILTFIESPAGAFPSTLCADHMQSSQDAWGWSFSWKPGLSSYLSNQKRALRWQSLDSPGSAPLPALLSLRPSSSHSSDVYAVTYQSRGFQEPWEWLWNSSQLITAIWLTWLLLDAYHLGLGMAYIIIDSQRIVCALNFRDCPVFSWQEYV